MFSDKLTKAIAEAAKTVMQNETWPDAASTSIYADKAGDAPISDTEASMDRKMTDEGANGTIKPGTQLRTSAGVWCVVDSIDENDSDYAWCSDEDGEELHVNLNSADVVKGGPPLRDREDQDHMRLGEGAITEADITEALKATQPASEWITDFVNSKDAKFKGKSKGERINMALGAYYAAQAGKSVKEGVEEPRSQGEKNFKAAHSIVKYRDVEQDDQTGTESMDQNAKPKLPIGTPFTKTEDIDGEKRDDKVAADIKSSAKRAVAPKASGAGKLKFTDAAVSDAKTVSAVNGSSKSATAPKATGSKQSGAQSIEKVSNSAPNGKLSAEYPKAGQKRPEAMPKGLKETALAALLGEATIEEGLFDNIKALGSNVAGGVKSKVAAIGQKIGDEIEKARQQGNAAELARLQARAKQLKLNLPADHADAAHSLSDSEYKKKSTSLYNDITTAQAALEKMKNDGTDAADIKALEARLRNYQLQYQQLNRQYAGDEPAKTKPVTSGAAAAVAQKAAQSKLTKMSTPQLQASLARIQALLKQRGVKEEVSFDEAFDILGEDAIKDCMSSFDKQYANDNEKALKQLLSGQGTKDIDFRLLTQLNKFITAYGDELKKHLGLPIVDGEKKDVKEAIDSASSRDDTGAFKGGSKQQGRVSSSNDDESDLTVVPDKINNPVVTALNDLQLALDRCHGFVSRSESYSNPNLIMRIQKIHTLLADVAEDLDNEPVKEAYGENSYSLSDVQSKFGAEMMDLIDVQGNTIIAVDDYGYEGLQINRFENVQNAKKYVQMVSSSTRDSDKSGATTIIDGPDTVYGPFEIKKIG